MSTQKALELLQLPDECQQFEGQIQSKTSRFLIVEETHDFTVSPRKISTRVYVSSSTELFGAYTFNMISNYIHSYGHGMPVFNGSVMTTNKPRVYGDNGRWMPWQMVELYPSESGGGHSFDVISDIGMNVNTDGTPSNPDNPFVRGGVFYRVQKSITRSSDGTTKTWTSKKQFVRWTVGQLCSVTGMTAEEISYNTRVTFNSVSVSPETHVTSISMDIETLPDNKIRGVFHINGEPATGAPGKVASYGKSCPSFVFRWNLYNEAGRTPYGSSVTASFTSDEDNTVSIVAGAKDMYDPIKRELMFNQSLETNAQVVAYAEFLPAQGKNENAGMVYGLETGIKDIWG
jgi:hypothetical protein